MNLRLSLFTALALVVGAHLQAAPAFILYGRGDYSLVTATVPAVKPADTTRALFLVAVQSALAQTPEFSTRMTLRPDSIPDSDSKNEVEGATGTFQFCDTFPGGFLMQLSLAGLAPARAYRLSLEGNPSSGGNGPQAEALRGSAGDSGYEFFTVTTDAQGRYEGTFAVALPAGQYDARLRVKDAVDPSFSLHRDYFRFEVK